MNVALIIAGGIGSRMKNCIPKQFILINDKPIIIYTLESFQKNKYIDKIAVVCLKDWENKLLEYTRKYHITKLYKIVTGGKSAQESIYNGVYSLDICNKNDIILIHDGVRPTISDEVISDCINKCEIYGNAVSALPYYEQIFYSEDGISTLKHIPRDGLMRVSTPQAYKYELLRNAYKKAFLEKIEISDYSYTNTMMVKLGYRLYFSLGSEKNIKLTTKENLEIFKLMLNNKEK